MRDWLTTGQCATALGVSTDYVRGEIRDGRLMAVIITREPRPGRSRANRAIRVYREAWVAYLHRYWPDRAECSTFHENRQNG